ncbi:sigma factor-like helix-turn-helix DNA-binding protein [Phytoactinopolyspora limicola]|uniref:sigma factor-like helix-turn-helix DNA-binding protein n=1 Tax=Phytoactinopolyspora limicola TaxID=2715536 RepID=UPI00140D3E2D|nr:sigma factor-like helix-turn-helix DNA-binding protein [Phytoactinopolyspora limicola]
MFVLREAFGYRYGEIAAVLDRTPEAVRQLAHRAREHVQARRPRVDVDQKDRQAVTERFMAAAVGGNISALMEVLAPDVTFCTDGGGQAKAALRVIVGREKIARLFTAKPFIDDLSTVTVRYVTINGDAAAILCAGDQLRAVGLLDLDENGERVRAIYGIVNPDKLRRVAAVFDLTVETRPSRPRNARPGHRRNHDLQDASAREPDQTPVPDPALRDE